MHTDNYFLSKGKVDSEEKMSGKREFVCGQLLGVFIFCLGFVGGILIGIYVYHDGPDSAVTCKNIPEWLMNGHKTTPADHTNFTTTPPSTRGTEDCELCKQKTFTYTINNQIQEPYFNNSVTMEIRKDSLLIYYIEKAVDENPSGFTRFKATYYPSLGYYIDTINNVTGNFERDQTYWQILNSTGPLSVGVSSYIPTDGDFVLFNFTVYSTNTDLIK